MSATTSFSDWKIHQTRRTRKEDTFRWGMSFLIVISSAGIATLSFLHIPHTIPPIPEAPPAAIAIDMAPEPVAIPSPPTDTPLTPHQTISESVPSPVDPAKLEAPPAPAPQPPLPVPKPEKLRKIIKKHKSTVSLKKPNPDKTLPAEKTKAPLSSKMSPNQTQAAPIDGSSSSHVSQSPATWQGALLARLEKYKRYPAEAMSAHQEGAPRLHFTMDRKGHVLSAHIEKSSGHSLLDSEALALVHRAEPLPSPPESVAGDSITLTVPIEFYMEHIQD
ncbi:energy transducer TonB [Acetobacter oryzifermentans]|uniref:energy transducer TonB family protein n=1 Tax=Acetobacter oryzifermentans TaxID=1633874 RepID=UPI0039BF8B5D